MVFGIARYARTGINLDKLHFGIFAGNQLKTTSSHTSSTNPIQAYERQDFMIQ